jgi:hypothetical protein
MSKVAGSLQLAASDWKLEEVLDMTKLVAGGALCTLHSAWLWMCTA